MIVGIASDVNISINIDFHTGHHNTTIIYSDNISVRENTDSNIISQDTDTTIIQEDNSNIIEDNSTDKIIISSNITSNIIVEQIVGSQGALGAPGGDEVPLAKQVDFIDDDDIYIGEATPGSLTSAAAWRIRHTTIAGDGDVSVTWADSVDTYTKIWDNRLSYSYG